MKIGASSDIIVPSTIWRIIHGTNCFAKIGANCNLSKNVLIGQELRGPRKGSPVLGNNVYVGIGAAIVGKVTIGDDVLIAPNSFVNFE